MTVARVSNQIGSSVAMEVDEHLGALVDPLVGHEEHALRRQVEGPVPDEAVGVRAPHAAAEGTRSGASPVAGWGAAGRTQRA